MSFGEIVLRGWRENLLSSVLVELTYRCNLKCFFCYNDLGREGVPLSTEQYLRFLDDLREMEVLNLTFSGGEPLAHPDFLVLGKRARELGFVVRIKSNGHALQGTLARRIKDEIDPFIIDLSLHGSRAETHDRQTMVPGSFDRLLKNISELQALGLRLKLNATMTRWNFEEVEAMYEIADDLGIVLAVSPNVAPRDDGDKEPLSIQAPREAKFALFELLAKRARAQGYDDEVATQVTRLADDGLGPVPVEKNCGAGSSHVTVDPYGDVLPCVQWRRPVGNLHEKSIQEIWALSAGLDEVRGLTVDALRMTKSSGPRGELLGFCPGQAELETGSSLEIYSSASEQRELLLEVEQDQKREQRLSLPIVS